MTTHSAPTPSTAVLVLSQKIDPAPSASTAEAASASPPRIMPTARPSTPIAAVPSTLEVVASSVPTVVRRLIADREVIAPPAVMNRSAL